MPRRARVKQEMPALKLSLELGTGAVPDNGRYHVLVDGQITFSTLSKAAAEAFYRTERDRLFLVHGRPEPAEVTADDRRRLIQDARLQWDLRGMNHELARTVVANARRKGGKGR